MDASGANLLASRGSPRRERLPAARSTKEFARMRALSSRTLGSALAVALATTGFAGAAQAASPLGPPDPDPNAAKAGQGAPPPLPHETAGKLKRQKALLPVARDLASQAGEAGSDIAGVRIDPDTGKVHVYRTDTGSPLDIGKKAAGVDIDVHPARFSRAEMNAA